MTAALIVAAVLIFIRVWLDRDTDPKPKPVAVLDMGDATPAEKDEFTERLLLMLHAVEQDPMLLDDLDRPLSDAEIAAITDEMGGPA